MGLKAVVNSTSDIPPAIREFYKIQDDGTYRLDVDAAEGFSLEDVSGLKTVLSETREKLRKTRERVEAYGDLEPGAAREALSKIKDMADWTPEDQVKAQIAAREGQLVERHNGELKTRDTTIAKLMKTLERNLIAISASAAIQKHKGVPELLLPVVERSVRMIENGSGEFVAQVVSADGTPLISSKSGSTDAMSIDEFVEGLKSTPEYGRAFDGSGASGSGALGGGVDKAGQKGVRRVSASDQEGINANIKDIAEGKIQVFD